MNDSDHNINISSEYKFEDEIQQPNPNQHFTRFVVDNENEINETNEENEESNLNGNMSYNNDNDYIIQEADNEENYTQSRHTEDRNSLDNSNHLENSILNKNIDVNKLLSEASINNIELFSNKIINKPKTNEQEKVGFRQSNRSSFNYNNMEKSSAKSNTKNKIEQELYIDAIKRKEKLEKLEYNVSNI